MPACLTPFSVSVQRVSHGSRILSKSTFGARRPGAHRDRLPAGSVLSRSATPRACRAHGHRGAVPHPADRLRGAHLAALPGTRRSREPQCPALGARPARRPTHPLRIALPAPRPLAARRYAGHPPRRAASGCRPLPPRLTLPASSPRSLPRCRPSRRGRECAIQAVDLLTAISLTADWRRSPPARALRLGPLDALPGRAAPGVRRRFGGARQEKNPLKISVTEKPLGTRNAAIAEMRTLTPNGSSGRARIVVMCSATCFICSTCSILPDLPDSRVRSLKLGHDSGREVTSPTRLVRRGSYCSRERTFWPRLRGSGHAAPLPARPKEGRSSITPAVGGCSEGPVCDRKLCFFVEIRDEGEINNCDEMTYADSARYPIAGGCGTSGRSAKSMGRAGCGGVPGHSGERRRRARASSNWTD